LVWARWPNYISQLIVLIFWAGEGRKAEVNSSKRTGRRRCVEKVLYKFTNIQKQKSTSFK
jgi:hypothetical protein